MGHLSVLSQETCWWTRRERRRPERPPLLGEVLALPVAVGMGRASGTADMGRPGRRSRPSGL